MEQDFFVNSDMNCRVQEVVSYVHIKGDSVLPHRHEHPELILYKGGNGVFSIGDEGYSHEGDMLVVVPKHAEHHEQTYTETDTKCCVLENDYFDPDEPVILPCRDFPEQFNRLYGLLREMGEIYITHGDTSNRRLGELSSEVLYIVKYIYTAQRSNHCDFAVELCNNAKAYIRANYRYTIRFEILAENIGYSYSRFRHIFSEVVGVGLKAYQIGVRMSIATRLLADAKMPVKEIAERVGYKNYICFFNYFKRMFHMSPLQYRKEVAKGNKIYEKNIFNLIWMADIEKTTNA